jgi:hypothetical protein
MLILIFLYNPASGRVFFFQPPGGHQILVQKNPAFGRRDLAVGLSCRTLEFGKRKGDQFIVVAQLHKIHSIPQIAHPYLAGNSINKSLINSQTEYIDNGQFISAAYVRKINAYPV